MKLSNYKHYLKNLYLYPHLIRIFLRKIKNRIFTNKAATEQSSMESRQMAENWCMKNEITIERALQEIDIEYNKDYFENKFQTILHASEIAVSNCPFKLGGAGNLSLIYQILESSDNEGFKIFCKEMNLNPLIIKDGNKYQGVIKK